MKRRLLLSILLCVLCACIFVSCATKTKPTGQQAEQEADKADEVPENPGSPADPNWMNSIGGWGFVCIDGDRTWYADPSEGGQLYCLLSDGTAERWSGITGASDLALANGELYYLHSQQGDKPLTLCRLDERTRTAEFVYTFEDEIPGGYFNGDVYFVGAVDRVLYFAHSGAEETVAVDVGTGEAETYPVAAAAVDQNGLYYTRGSDEETKLCRMSFGDGTEQVLLQGPCTLLGVRQSEIWYAVGEADKVSLWVLHEDTGETELLIDGLDIGVSTGAFMFAAAEDGIYAVFDGQICRSDESGGMQVLCPLPEAVASGWMSIPSVAADGGLLVVSHAGVLYMPAGEDSYVELAAEPVYAPVETAVDALTKHWENEYRQWEESDGYLEIKNTRVIHIDPETENEYFHGIECVVEFILYSDYLGTAPYYHNVQVDDAVVLYENGTVEVTRNPFRVYTSAAYQRDYSEFIVSMEDLGGAYNQVFDLK